MSPAAAPGPLRSAPAVPPAPARHPLRVVWAALLLLVIAAVAGAGLPAHLSHGGFTSPRFESDRALELIGQHFVPGGNSTVGIVHSDDLTVDDPRFAAALGDALAELPNPPLVTAVHHWNTGRDELLSTDRHSAMVAIGLAGRDENERVTSYEQLRRSFHPAGFDVRYTGLAPLLSDFDHVVDHDLTRSELLAVPVLFLLLVLFFRGLVAALVPLAMAAAGLTASYAALRALTLLLPVHYVTVNVTAMVVLGLTVDYSLFVVARFRRELAGHGGRGEAPDAVAAVAATTASVGRMVASSTAAIALSSLGLTLLPIPVARSLGLGVAIGVTLCGLTSLTLLPAALALLGDRIDAGRLLRTPAPAGSDGFWYAVGRATVRRPALWISAAVLAIAALSAPAAGLHLASSDQRTLPETSASRVAADALAKDFPGAALDHLQVFTQLRTDLRTGTGSRALHDWLDRLEGLPGVRHVRLWATTAHTAYLAVESSSSPDSPSGTALVRSVRSLGAPDGGKLLVGGLAARNVDTLDSLAGRLPLLVGYLLATVGALLCAAFRSVVVPVKAALTTAMSLGVSYAVVTWTIQQGHGSRLLGFTPTGYVGAIESITMLMLVFALSVDYEIFLIAHVRECYDRGESNSTAIVEGLGRTGGLITAAAALVMAVAAAFTTSPVLTVKEIALGTLVAVGVDATLVRSVLVPAGLRLLGELNWWTPFRRRSRRGSGPLRSPWTREGAATGEMPQ